MTNIRATIYFDTDILHMRSVRKKINEILSKHQYTDVVFFEKDSYIFNKEKIQKIFGLYPKLSMRYCNGYVFKHRIADGDLAILSNEHYLKLNDDKGDPLIISINDIDWQDYVNVIAY